MHPDITNRKQISYSNLCEIPPLGSDDRKIRGFKKADCRSTSFGKPEVQWLPEHVIISRQVGRVGLFTLSYCECEKKQRRKLTFTISSKPIFLRCRQKYFRQTSKKDSLSLSVNGPQEKSGPEQLFNRQVLLAKMHYEETYKLDWVSLLEPVLRSIHA